MTRARGVADYGYYPPVNNNILINPSFTVNQRGDVIDHNTSTYGPDRWGVSRYKHHWRHNVTIHHYY